MKSSIPGAFNFSTLLAAALIAASPAMAMDSGTITDGTRTLNGGTVYTVSGNVTINAAVGQSALTAVANSGDGGNKVVIEIKDGGSLTVTGGNANGRDGAGAGIMLPSDMTLYVTGKGRLTATGGNAAGGGNGSSGGSAEYSDTGDNHHKNGAGGDGGNGGGGAAAGIGGSGGMGASGGKGGAQLDWRYSYHGKYFPADGKPGESSSDGTAGASGGSVYILGDVAVTVNGGSAGGAGGAGSSYGSNTDESAGDDWHAGGGGQIGRAHV